MASRMDIPKSWALIAYSVLVLWGILFSLSERTGLPSMWHLPESKIKRAALGMFIATLLLLGPFLNHPDKRIIVYISIVLVGLLAIGLSDFVARNHRNIAAFFLWFPVGCTALFLLDWYFWPEPIEIPISFRMGCEWGSLPIHIRAASTIHVIRLHPSVLDINRRFPGTGVFENITAPAGKSVDWPTKANGRWMTQKELDDAFASGSPHFPYASKCVLTSYSPGITLDEITANLLIDIPDTTKPKSIPEPFKRFSFPISFNPLMSGRSFEFYIVNTCSSGAIPSVIQWGDSARVQVLGEQDSRQVPLRFEKLNFPSQLLSGSLGATNFIWSDLHNCQWEKQ